MSRLISCFLLFVFLNTGAGNAPRLSRTIVASATPPQTRTPIGATPDARGAWLARAIDDRDRGRDVRMTMRMRLFDAQNRVRERVLTLNALRGGAGRPVPDDRTLIRFTFPKDIDGTGFLVWAHDAADDERFLYLPSLGRVRRIAGTETQESFVGSDFTYEDIGGREFENYTYRLLEEGADAVWRAIDGTAFPVYRLESRARDPRARFPRVVSLVRRDALVVVHAEIQNPRDEVQKTFDVARLEQVQGFWTSRAMTMTDVLERTRTELAVESVTYNVGLTADDVGRRALERGGSR